MSLNCAGPQDAMSETIFAVDRYRRDRGTNASAFLLPPVTSRICDADEGGKPRLQPGQK
jgi:hypothetical protein